METEDLFHTKSRRIRDFADIQVRLYRHDPTLRQYFMQLQIKMQTSAGLGSNGATPIEPRFKLPVRAVNKLIKASRGEKFRADILFCPAPYFDRRTENKLTERTLMGLVNTGATVVCLLPSGEAVRHRLETQLAATGRTTQVMFLDPVAPSNRFEARLRYTAARVRAWSALQVIAGILDPLGVRFGHDAQLGFEHTASYIESWERLAPSVEFETAVVRCHWNTLCSAVCSTALERGKQAITFQQGVIAHTLDVPVTATKYLAFGATSAVFLEKLNRRFFQSAERAPLHVDYLPSGSIIDDIQELPEQFNLKTLLFVDVQADSGDFYGVTSQCQALLSLVEKFLASDVPFTRLIIRPHPFWSELEVETILNLARTRPDRCEISHPAWSLEDDLRRSSAAVGIYSGALTVAAASGLPTFFLRTEGGFTTEDLACFCSQTFYPEDAFKEIEIILRDASAYSKARQKSLKNARAYYADGTNLDFSPGFFERLIAGSAPTTMKHTAR